MSQDVRAQIMGNVDKTMREWSGGDSETSSRETSDLWSAVGVGEEHHPGAMMEPEHDMVDGQHQDGDPVEEHSGVAGSKRSRNGKGSAGSTS